MTMDLGLLGGEMRMLMDEGVVYMKSPMFDRVGTDWVSIDPSKLSPSRRRRSAGSVPARPTPPRTRVSSPACSTSRPPARRRSAACPRSTTRARSTTKAVQNFGDVVGEDVDDATKEQLEAAVDQFEALHRRAIPFEMWIDEENLPRRMKISMDFGDLVPGSDEAKMDMTVDYRTSASPCTSRSRRSPRSRT